ncbi:hypothetical protein HGB24_01200 [Candidatus Saccharibacteria bacterium]|nr:hypothetical protein [Candidatus Saccharibacteria bacterium]
MNTSIVKKRQTKYCLAIEDELARLGHATNARLLELLRQNYPDLSATTIHRATTRLCGRGEISIAPPAPDGSIQYDSNTEPHDHFQCSVCGMLKDTNIKAKIIDTLESSIGDCDVSGQLTIIGICKNCKK